MQGVKAYLLMLLLPTVALAGNNWDVTLPGGSMRFQGEIIAESCRVEAGDQQLTVNMGQISSNRFRTVGEDSNPVPFDIHLKDCNKAVRQNVGISFFSVADGKNPNILSIGEGEGIATGVGIALFDQENRLITLNAPPSLWARVENGSTTLHLVAKYRATDRSVTGGAAKAQAWFSLTYQ